MADDVRGRLAAALKAAGVPWPSDVLITAALLPTVEALLAEARAEGAAEALQTAADELAQGWTVVHGERVPGILRERAAALRRPTIATNVPQTNQHPPAGMTTPPERGGITSQTKDEG